MELRRRSDAVSTAATVAAELPPTAAAIPGAAISGAAAPVPLPAPASAPTVVLAQPAGTTTKQPDDTDQVEDDNQPPTPACPPRFGDGNTEPGGHLECCCPGVRISYCMLSQVVVASLVVLFIIGTLASALF